MSFLFNSLKRVNTTAQKFQYDIVAAMIRVTTTVPNLQLAIVFIRGPRMISSNYVDTTTSIYNIIDKEASKPLSLISTMYRESNGKCQTKSARLLIKSKYNGVEKEFGRVEIDLANYNGIDNTYDISCEIEKCDKKAKIQFSIHSKHLKELDGIPDDAISSISDLSTLDVKYEKKSDVADLSDLNDFDELDEDKYLLDQMQDFKNGISKDSNRIEPKKIASFIPTAAEDQTFINEMPSLSRIGSIPLPKNLESNPLHSKVSTIDTVLINNMKNDKNRKISDCGDSKLPLSIPIPNSLNHLQESISPTGSDKYISGSGFKNQNGSHSHLDAKIVSLTSQQSEKESIGKILAVTQKNLTIVSSKKDDFENHWKQSQTDLNILLEKHQMVQAERDSLSMKCESLLKEKDAIKLELDKALTNSKPIGFDDNSSNTRRHSLDLISIKTQHAIELARARSENNSEHIENLKLELACLRKEKREWNDLNRGSQNYDSDRQNWVQMQGILEFKVVQLDKELLESQQQCELLRSSLAKYEFKSTYGITNNDSSISGDSQLKAALDKSSRQVAKLAEVVAELEKKYLDRQIQYINAMDMYCTLEAENIELKESTGKW